MTSGRNSTTHGLDDFRVGICHTSIAHWYERDKALAARRASGDRVNYYMSSLLSGLVPFMIQSTRMRSIDAYGMLVAEGLTDPITTATMADALQLTRAQASEVGAGLVAMGLASRIRRGLILLKPPAEIGTQALGEDIFRSAIAMVDKEHSYLGFYSALHHHALVVRPVSTVFVATTTRRRTRRVGGTQIKFVTVVADRIFGVEHTSGAIPWSDPERTLVDGLARPEYCGQMDVVIAAFHRHGSSLDVARLREYVERYGVITVAKRAEYIMERLGLTTGKATSLALSKQRRTTLLDPHGTREGTPVRHWELIDNTPERAWHGG